MGMWPTALPNSSKMGPNISKITIVFQFTFESLTANPIVPMDSTAQFRFMPHLAAFSSGIKSVSWSFWGPKIFIVVFFHDIMLHISGVFWVLSFFHQLLRWSWDLSSKRLPALAEVADLHSAFFVEGIYDPAFRRRRSLQLKDHRRY